jgi:MerR family copper efflux transcriptional regulator
MNIGTAARRTGVSAKTIRYYETVGLIRAASRSASGYRVFSENDIQTLRFIKRARGLGFSVEDVTGLLALWHDTHRASADVKTLAANQVAKIERKIAELQAMRETLTTLMEHCHGDARPDCPILEDLAGLEAVEEEAERRDLA